MIYIYTRIRINLPIFLIKLSMENGSNDKIDNLDVKREENLTITNLHAYKSIYFPGYYASAILATTIVYGKYDGLPFPPHNVVIS